MQGTNGGHGDVLVVDELVGGSFDGSGVDGVDACKDLSGAEAASVGEHAAANVLADLAAAVKVGKHGGLELGAGAGDLLLGGAVAQAHHALESVEHKVVERGGLGDSVHTEETSVLVAGVEAHDGVSSLVLGDGLAELGAAVGAEAGGAGPAAEHGLHHHEGVGVLRGPSCALKGEGDVCELLAVLADADLGSHEASGLHGSGNSVGGLLGEATEVLVTELGELLVVDGSGTGHNHAGGGVVSLDVAAKVIAGDRHDVLGGSEDGASEAGAHEGGLVKAVEDDLLLLLLDLLHLAEDDIAFAVDGCGVEGGVLKDVAEDLHSLGDVLLEHLGVVDGLLTRGVGVEVATHVLDLHLELSLSAVGGALEGHVLEEVRDTVVLLSLVSAAGVDPHAHGGGLAVAALGSHTEAVSEGAHLSRGRLEDVLGELAARGGGGRKAAAATHDSSADHLVWRRREARKN